MFRKRKIAVGSTIRKRTTEYPAFAKEPRKKTDCWIECPDFDIRKRKKIAREEEEKDRPYSVTIHAPDHLKVLEMLNYMIIVGREEIVSDRMAIWLHATRFSTTRAGGFYSCVLTYIFRIRAIPEEIEENL